MNMIKKTALTAVAITAISFASLGAGVSDANAGGKKFKRFHHFYTGYHYNYGHYCKPKFRKIWVWSPRHGHKIKRWVKVGKWCGGRYYSIY